mmetsp:Transcript_18347/g.25882  ORF Transcript_18347/g.25882 Transcript_18347/m.25882 type:complete len:189 (+) Transcript_18347:245-811(+)
MPKVLSKEKKRSEKENGAPVSVFCDTDLEEDGESAEQSGEINKHETVWNQMYEELIAYKNEYGDCLVPIKWSENERLSTWVGTQRSLETRMRPDRRQKLSELGFCWKLQIVNWNIMYDRLCDFKATEGHCFVPLTFRADPKLGRWVKNQRSRVHSLTEERKALLNELDFEWSAESHRGGRKNQKRLPK